MNILKIAVSTFICTCFAFSLSVLSFANEPTFLNADSKDPASYVYLNKLDDPLSLGLSVLSYNMPMIVSGEPSEEIFFSAENFEDHDGLVPTSVKILSLPNESSGTLFFDSSPVSIGQTISVLTLGRLSYIPKNTNNAEFIFTPDNTSVQRCIIKQKEGKNKPPAKVGDVTVTTFTNMNTPVGGYLDGIDPDKDPITFEITEYPSKGILTLTDRSSGHFVYHPYVGESGEDSFSYRICDDYGSYSENIISELDIAPTGITVFDDMKDSLNNTAVYNITKSGIMESRKNADGEFFDPNLTVSRIDFLIMTMKTCGAGEAEEITKTPFSDDDSLSGTEKGYLSAAYRLGIVKGTNMGGELLFRPKDPITGAEAAVIINGILGLSSNEDLSVMYSNEAVPAWAKGSVFALASEGIININKTPADSVVTREASAVILMELSRKIV